MTAKRPPPELTLDLWAALAFSAKEAYYKAYFPLAGTFLDFQEVRCPSA